MAIEPFPSVGRNDDLNKVREALGELCQILDFLFDGGIDSLNIRKLTAEKITTGTLLANLVTIMSNLTGGAFIRINGDGMVVNNGTKDVLTIDTSGNLSTEDGVITGGTVRTAADNNQRIEMSSGSFKGYTALNQLSGLVFDPNKTNDIVDLFLYHRGVKLVEFFDGINQYRIRGGSGATVFTLGGNSVTTNAEGAWDFTGTVTGIPISAITNLQSQLDALNTRMTYLENFAFTNVTRSGTLAVFDSKNITNVDSVDVT